MAACIRWRLRGEEVNGCLTIFLEVECLRLSEGLSGSKEEGKGGG